MRAEWSVRSPRRPRTRRQWWQANSRLDVTPDASDVRPGQITTSMRERLADDGRTNPSASQTTQRGGPSRTQLRFHRTPGQAIRRYLRTFVVLVTVGYLLARVLYFALVYEPLAVAALATLAALGLLYRAGWLTRSYALVGAALAAAVVAYFSGTRYAVTLATLRPRRAPRPFVTSDGLAALAQLESVRPDPALALQARLTYQAFAALAARESPALWMISPAASSRPLVQVLAANPALLGQYRSALLAPAGFEAALNPAVYEFLAAQPALAGLQGFAWQQAHAAHAAAAHTWLAAGRQREAVTLDLPSAGVPAAAAVVVRLGRPSFPDPSEHQELFFAGWKPCLEIRMPRERAWTYRPDLMQPLAGRMSRWQPSPSNLRRPVTASLPPRPRGARPFSRLCRPVRQATIAFGPQHPAAHGILKLSMEVQGEALRRLDPQFGLLHRGTEKLMEGRGSLQVIPYFDRFDYVANLAQEHAICLALEALRGECYLSAATLLARTLFDELSRIMNHLLTLSATALDLSAMGPIFWAFEERENVMALFEQASGARMHTSLYRPFEFDLTPLTQVFFQELVALLTRCGRSLSGAFLGLLANRSLRSRLASVGQLSTLRTRAYGITGLIARSAGFLVDRRLQRAANYGAYGSLSFRLFLGRRGDNLDRFLLRVKETVEGFRLVTQLIQTYTAPRLQRGRRARLFRVSALPAWSQLPRLGGVDAWALVPAEPQPTATPLAAHRASLLGPLAGLAPAEPQRGKFVSMEATISHFRVASEGYPLAAGLAYQSVESPKGEAGTVVVGTGSPRASRIKLRTPVAHNMHLIPAVNRGAMFADFVATFCSLDIVLGEIDR